MCELLSPQQAPDLDCSSVLEPWLLTFLNLRLTGRRSLGVRAWKQGHV